MKREFICTNCGIKFSDKVEENLEEAIPGIGHLCKRCREIYLKVRFPIELKEAIRLKEERVRKIVEEVL